MKTLRILLGISLIWLTVPVSCINSNSDASNAAEEQNKQVKHGKNGKNGQNGENGQDGEDGQNGGNGGNGGDGGSGWLRGGDGGNGGDAGDSLADVASEQGNGEVDEWEYKILKETCRQIIAVTISKFYDPSDSRCLATYKQNISNYLLQIGTAAAQKIWQEYENIQWSYPASTSV